jgi:dienelactone hydrolase
MPTLTGLALVILIQAAAPASPQLWAGLPAGVHDVGFRRLDIAPGACVWYPAARVPNSAAGRMTMKSYLGAGAEAFSGVLRSAKVPDPSVRAYVDAELLAVPNAPPASGSFPIVALAQGNAEMAADQAVLAEFLASHGYIVVTADSPMIATPMATEDEVGPMAERQAVELSRVVDAVLNWPSARRSVRFAAGHSFGARAALLMAMRDTSIRGVISLDGGIGTATAADSFRRAPAFAAAKATAPILHFYEELDDFMKPDFSLLRGLPAKLTLTLLPGMHHAHFTSIGFGAAAIPALASLTEAGPELGASLRRLGRDILSFMDAAGRN